MENQNGSTEARPLKSCDPLGCGRHNNGAITSTDSQTETVAQDTQEKPDTMKWSKVSWKKLYTFLLIFLSTFIAGCEFYFIVPFFTKESKKKEVSSTSYGVILSILHLTIFVCSPIFGNYISLIGARFMFVSGAFVGGCSTILFGLVDHCDTATSFIAVSILCRIMTAVGISASCTAGCAILANCFSDHITTVFGLVQLADGAGFMIGPVLGGFLYQMCGFSVTFYIMGALVLVSGLLLCTVGSLPTGDEAPREGSILSLARSPLFDIVILNVTVASLGVAFVDPILVDRLAPFNLSPALIGLVYFAGPALYGISCPAYGYLADVKNIPASLVMAGTSIIGIAYLLIGPCPGFSFLPSDLWLVIVSFGLVGFGFGSCSIPSMKLLILGTTEIGFANNLDTYGLVSGAFYSSVSLGCGVGNSLGGFLMDVFGFQEATMFVGLLHFATTFITMIFFGIRRRQLIQKKNFPV